VGELHGNIKPPREEHWIIYLSNELENIRRLSVRGLDKYPQRLEVPHPSTRQGHTAENMHEARANKCVMGCISADASGVGGL